MRTPSLRAVCAFSCTRRRWVTYLKLAGSNFVQLALAIGQSMMLSLLAAQLGTVQVATHNALAAVFELGGSVLYGMGDAVSVRVGYHLGRGAVKAAKRVVVVTVAVGVVWGALFAATVLPERRLLGRFFSDDPAVLDAAADVMPWLAASYLSYAVYIQLISVMDGQGRAAVQPVVGFAGCWLTTGLLALLSMHYTSFGLPGLWGAEWLGNSVSAAVTAILVARSNWRQLAKDAVARSEADDAAEAAEAAAVEAEAAAYTALADDAA